MKVKYKDSLKCKVLKQIDKISGNIVLRSDLSKIGRYRQINFVLTNLVKEGRLIRIAFGVYAKTFKSQYTGKYILQGGFFEDSIEALDRLGIKWDLTSAQKSYNAGQTTQVPATPTIRLKSRCRRSFRYQNATLKYEEGIYAR